MTVRDLEPKALWNNFADLNAVPRASKKEEEVIQFMVDYGKKLGLETKVDAIGNVIIYKPATSGMEDRKKVILQSHLDMVHQKNEATQFDFTTEGIRMLVDGDWVKAEGTTLGADNGIGVATIMSVLSSSDIAHPAVEAMFTIDEETGMTGAMQLDGSNFSGEILLNLDTEDDDELSIGCAGGIDTNTFYNYQMEAIDNDASVFEIRVLGLNGGHSGMDIIKELGNANKILVRVLKHILDHQDFQLISFDGGGLRNAIPREAKAIIAVDHEFEGRLDIEFITISRLIKEEFKSLEQNLEIVMNPSKTEGKAMVSSDRNKVINSLYAVFNGVFRMSPDFEGLVEASSSLARVIVLNGEFKTQSLQRSSVESSKTDVANTVRAPFDLIGAKVEQTGDYPGWQPNTDSAILNIMADLYRSKFNEEPQIKACHAGLECGILGKHLPGVDMISFGPNIRGAHSPDEKVQISSVQKYWDFFLDTLQSIPQK